MFTKKIVVVTLLVLALMTLPPTPKATSMPEATPQDSHFILATVVLIRDTGQTVNISMRMDTRTGETWIYEPGTIQVQGQARKVTGWFDVPEGGLRPKP